MFKALIGDMFLSQAQTLVNTVNCVGVMGKGVALAFKQRYPTMVEDYISRCERKQVQTGKPYLYKDLLGTMILNFPTKDHWRSPSRLSYIENGLDYFVEHYSKWGIKSIAFPPLGCGNGGLEWSEVGPLIYKKLAHLDIEIEVYAPYGTPKHELTNDFLSMPSQMTLEGNGRKIEKLNPEWVVLLEVLLELGKQPYASPVGRTVFQKICYVVTEMGVQTGFNFKKGSYGPFATEVKLALHEFANRNWIREEPFGQMITLRVGNQYEEDRSKFKDLLAQYDRKIAKTVDLFSRIKNTEQAEEVLTVLFASRQLKQAEPQQEVGEQQLYDFILNWKKTWNTDDKKKAVANAIQNLTFLGWMKIQLNDAAMEAI